MSTLPALRPSREVGPFGREQVRFDSVKKAAYVAFIRQGVRRIAAAELVGISYLTLRRHMKSDLDFAEQVSMAEMARVDDVERALYEAALAGNVVAQQVVLYNRRPEEWADQRMIKAQREAALAAEQRAELEGEKQAIDGLRSKLLELRDRLGPEVEEDAEPETVTIQAVE